MLNSSFFPDIAIKAWGKTVSAAVVVLFILSSAGLYTQDYGGFTDPKTPNRHSRVNVDSAKIEVKPHGIYAEVTTEFWYRSVDLKASTDTLELYALFTLPNEDFVNDSWLWVNDTMVHAMIIDVDAASLIYENIVHRLHKDPSIFYRRNTSGLYEYRVYPNVGSQSRHAKYSYWTKMSYVNGLAQFTFKPAIIGLSTNKAIPRSYRFYFTKNFSDIDFGANPPNKYYSNDKYGKYVEFSTTSTDLKQVFSYQYDFSTPYFSKSNYIDDQEYYFAMFDSKILLSKYVNQKINFLIDYDVNKTSIAAKELIYQLKKTILSNFNSNDSINIMIGGKNTINLFNRWIPCDKDTINLLIDSTVSQMVGYYSFLSDLMTDGIKFNAGFNTPSSIVLLTCSEYAPTPTTANPIIENCLRLMGDNIYKITTVDFSDVHYSQYSINSKNYSGDQYFNEKIAEMTRSEYYTVKGSKSTVFSMLNTAFSSLKGTVSDVGLYIEPTDGITIAKTSESLTDSYSNTKLIYEYGKLEGSCPIEAKFSALLDGKPVIRKYIIDYTSLVVINESAKMWNWKYMRALEDNYYRTKKETNDLRTRSITNRILTIQTAFLCLEPWMMSRDTMADDEDQTTAVSEEVPDAGLEITYGPNPIVSNLSVRLNITNENTKVLSVAVYDVLGNVVKEFAFDSYSQSIELNWDATSDGNGKVSPGVYYLVVRTSSGQKILKLVVA